MERRRTRYPGIYEYTARGGRRRYQVVFRTGRAAGAPQRAASFDTLKEARDYQISQGHRVREGTYFDPKKGEITLAEFFHEFMRLAGPEEPKSRTNYEANFRNHIEPVLGSTAIRDVDAEAVAELLSNVRSKRRRSRGDGKATVRQVHALVRRIFNVAVKLGRLPRYFPNPAAAIEVSSPEPRGVRPLDVWDVEAIARAIRPMYGPLVYLMAYSGLRIGEACALQWKHLDLDGGWVHVRRAFKENGGELYLGTPKDDEVRDVPLLPAVVEALREHRQSLPPASQETPVFTSPTGSQIWPASFRGRDFAGACKVARLDPLPTPHVLRHTAASMMARAGWPESYIRQALGHGSTEMTKRYVHLYDRAHEENRTRLTALVAAETTRGARKRMLASPSHRHPSPCRASWSGFSAPP